MTLHTLAIDRGLRTIVAEETNIIHYLSRRKTLLLMSKFIPFVMFPTLVYLCLTITDFMCGKTLCKIMIILSLNLKDTTRSSFEIVF